MKSLVVAAAVSFLALPAIAGVQPAVHGVERGRVVFPVSTEIPYDVRQATEKAIENACSTTGVTYVVSDVKVESKEIDQGQVDDFYSLQLIATDSRGSVIGSVSLTIADLAISNPRVPSILVDHLSADGDVCGSLTP